jgi:hypothetical protein
VAGVGDEVKDRTVLVAHRNGGVAGASAAVSSWCGQCGEAALHDKAVAIGQHWLVRASNCRALPVPFLSAKDAKKAEHIELRPLSMARVPLTCSSLRP